MALTALAAAGPTAAFAEADGGAANAPVTAGRMHLRKPALAAPSPATTPRWACPEGACQAIVIGQRIKVAQGSGEQRGLDPQDLQSAYNIPATLEEPQTIALVDAYGYPDAESDLAKYRERYGLPPCTKKNGCFEKVNESGEPRHYPAEEEGWDLEAALDEDMASAACPQCHILLVEGNGELPAELGESVNTAVKLGATEISNSYAYPEKLKEYCGKKGCSQYNPDYEHPGVLITAASGDSGYADAYFELGYSTVNFPATSPDVIAVGGTALFKEEEVPRKWFEEVWNEPFLAAGTGSGCSKHEPKPAWQTDAGCSKRTDNDVAAVAAAVSPVSVRIDGFWELVAGTSVASPLVAGIEAHASAHERALGARAFYEDPGSLFDVTQGFDWDPLDESGTSECAPNEYLCNAEVGYDGPTGLGTPDGVPVETVKPPTVTKVTPDHGRAAGGRKVKIEGTNLEGAEEVKFGTATAGFSVRSAKLITTEAPAGSGTVDVTVTTPDGTSAITTADQFTYR
ncbi:MAG TPA: IPT/TIG domain-containing protein [Solirubrobacteraceae bacterium]|nr:IPT/TIG domain-containing protein [Solirubrobacteraceae bacterium]